MLECLIPDQERGDAPTAARAHGRILNSGRPGCSPPALPGARPRSVAHRRGGPQPLLAVPDCAVRSLSAASPRLCAGPVPVSFSASLQYRCHQGHTALVTAPFVEGSRSSTLELPTGPQSSAQRFWVLELASEASQTVQDGRACTTYDSQSGARSPACTQTWHHHMTMASAPICACRTRGIRPCRWPGCAGPERAPAGRRCVFPAGRNDLASHRRGDVLGLRCGGAAQQT